MNERNRKNNNLNLSETGILSFSPSLLRVVVDNFYLSLILFVFVWTILPLVYFIKKYLEVKATNYQLTNERIFIKTGILYFDQEINYLEFYRIKDIKLKRGFLYHFIDFLRIWLRKKPLLLADIWLYTNDFTQTNLEVKTIVNALVVSECIRNAVNQDKSNKKMMRTD